MRILSRVLSNDRSGSIKLLPSDEDDMYHLYHLLADHDRITATSTRKVTLTSTTGSSSTQKHTLKLTLSVEDISYDSSTSTIRVKGTNVLESDYIKLGQYHTLDLSVNTAVTIEKDCWDDVYLSRLEESTDVKKNADVGALIMQPGLAHLCLITTHQTCIKAKIELSIPKKRLNSLSTHQHDTQSQRFFSLCYDSLIKHIDFSLIKCLIIASPGFLREDFWRYCESESLRVGERMIMDNKSKVLLLHSSSGHKHALTELLSSPSVISRIEVSKSINEVKIFEQWQSLLMTEPEKAYYGYNHVKHAIQANAIETLLISDELFKHKEFKERAKYVDIVEQVKVKGGQVVVFSSAHVTGEQLGQVTGIAAILRFPMPETEMENYINEMTDEETEQLEKKERERDKEREEKDKPNREEKEKKQEITRERKMKE